MLFQTWLEQFPVCNEDENYGVSLKLEPRAPAAGAVQAVDNSSILAARGRHARMLEAWLKDRPATQLKLEALMKKNAHVLGEDQVGDYVVVRTSALDTAGDHVFVAANTTARQLAKKLGTGLTQVILCAPTVDAAVPDDLSVLDFRCA